MIRDTGPDPTRIQAFRFILEVKRPVSTMKDCSVVTASYELGEGMKGTIGIIGPKRMDYENVVDTLKTLKVQLGYHIS